MARRMVSGEEERWGLVASAQGEGKSLSVSLSSSHRSMVDLIKVAVKHSEDQQHDGLLRRLRPQSLDNGR